jgi:hypothetical protein
MGIALKGIEVFTSGKHTDSSGRVWSYTDSDLERIARLYNTQTIHEAPAVKGHPKSDDPAYGWLDRGTVRVDKSRGRGRARLLADFRDVDPGFEKDLRARRFKKRSISLYPSGLIRHVGWLGAMPPSVKGMSDDGLPGAFSEIEDSYASFDFAEAVDTTNNDEGPKMTDEQLAAILEALKPIGEGVAKLLETKEPAKEEEKKEETPAADAGASEQFSELEKLRDEKRELEVKVRRQEFSDRLNQADLRGRISKGARDGILDTLELVYTSGAGQEFSEGTSPVDKLLETLKALPARPVDFSEIATSDKVGDVETDPAVALGRSIGSALK